jgi:hypothetical protein
MHDTNIAILHLQCCNSCEIKMNFYTYIYCSTQQVVVKITSLKVIHQLNFASSLKSILLFFDWRLLTAIINLAVDDTMATHHTIKQWVPSFWLVLPLPSTPRITLKKLVKPLVWLPNKFLETRPLNLILGIQIMPLGFPSSRTVW